MFIVLAKRLDNEKAWYTFRTRRALDAWMNTKGVNGDIVIDVSLSQCYRLQHELKLTISLRGLDDAQKTDLGSETFPLG